MKYSFHEEELVITTLAMDDECPQCPDDEGMLPTIHFDKETVDILMIDKFDTSG
jgi:hypothetical protein